jgi:N-acetylneuraminic acid mutarotase
MKLKLLVLSIIISNSINAQWVSRAAFPGVARAKSTSFTIGDKFYVLGGVTNSSVVLNDFWEYNITTNTWLQKPNFPGPERYGAVSFILGNTGYIATGGNDNGYLDDMWQYDPVSDSWLQRIGLPAGSAQHENQRTEAFGFVINNKAYLGGGIGFVFGANQTNNIAFYDLWEYNPTSNSWTTKADLPDFTGRNMGVGIAMNGKGYVGLGCNVDQTVNHNTFWEYDPTTDAWTSKAPFPSNFTADAATFVLDSLIYLIGGVNLNPLGLSNQVYTYDAVANTWTQLSNYSGGAVAGPFCISTGTRAFVGGGYNSGIVPRNDVWEFASATTGINEMENSSSAIYPNPSSGFIYFHSSEDIERIELFNLTGQKISSCNNLKGPVDISGLSDGIYIVRMISRNGNINNERIIKSGQ